MAKVKKPDKIIINIIDSISLVAEEYEENTSESFSEEECMEDIFGKFI